MARFSRRNLLKSGPALAAGAAVSAGGPPKRADADTAGLKFTFGHTMPFGEQYYVEMQRILNLIRRNQIRLVGELTDRMADTVKKGGNVWMQANVGHMGRFENDETLPGHPGILRSSPSFSEDDFARVKAGDVFVTNSINENVRALRDRGVYVVGVPVNYIDNEWTPEGFVHPNVNNWKLGDVSSVILQSYIPYTQGVVEVPQIPEMKVMPCSANALYMIYWAIQAEVADKYKNSKRPGAFDTALTVMDTIIGRIDDAYRLQKDYMFDAAPAVAKRIGNGAHFHVTSDHPGVQEESNRVAMGPMMTNAFRDDMKAGDVHLLATIDPNSQTILDWAAKSKDMGMHVVTIAPGNAHHLRRYSDTFIDNLCPEGAGLLDISGYDGKIGTVAGVLNNTLMWIFTSQFVDEMVRRGWIPWFYMGYYAIGGRDYCQAIRPFFERQGF